MPVIIKKIFLLFIFFMQLFAQSSIPGKTGSQLFYPDILHSNDESNYITQGTSLKNNLNRSFSLTVNQYLGIKDTADTNVTYDRGPFRIFGEFALGSVLGFFMSIPIAAGSQINKAPSVFKNWAFIYSLYVIGSSFGVYIIAKGGNDKLQFLPTLTAGVIAGLIALAPTVEYEIGEVYGDYPFLLFLIPLAGTLVYANLIAPYPPPQNTETAKFIYENNTFSFKDIYNGAMLFKVNLLRIEL